MSSAGPGGVACGDGYRSGNRPATRGRRRRGDAGAPGHDGQGPAGGPGDVGRRGADEEGAHGVGQGRRVHGAQRLVGAAAFHGTRDQVHGLGSQLAFD